MEDKMDLFLRKNYPDNGTRRYVGNFMKAEIDGLREGLRSQFRSVNVIQHPTQPGMSIVDCLRIDYNEVSRFCDGFLVGWNARASYLMMQGKL